MSERFLHVDPTMCVGHGLCWEILPELIGVDDWGYPLLPEGPIPREYRRRAARARAACPALALRLDGIRPRQRTRVEP
ncbi:MAG: ferredoxin [Candidatus Dormibacteraeota bacterium]|jgi:ferredoxin|nr:ferredoxin [Candidatus Dormibacteraeota bacterium]